MITVKRGLSIGTTVRQHCGHLMCGLQRMLLNTSDADPLQYFDPRDMTQCDI